MDATDAGSGRADQNDFVAIFIVGNLAAFYIEERIHRKGRLATAILVEERVHARITIGADLQITELHGIAQLHLDFVDAEVQALRCDHQ